MPLIRNIEDPKFVKQLERLDSRDQFIHALASLVLADHDGFESVWSIANGVYDQHCSPQAGWRNRRGFDQSSGVALSA